MKPYPVGGSTEQDLRLSINEGISYKVADCEMIGVPKPHFRWYKDGKLIVENNNTLGIYFTNRNKRFDVFTYLTV